MRLCSRLESQSRLAPYQPNRCTFAQHQGQVSITVSRFWATHRLWKSRAALTRYTKRFDWSTAAIPGDATIIGRINMSAELSAACRYLEAEYRSARIELGNGYAPVVPGLA
jgi:hypothetical protein